MPKRQPLRAATLLVSAGVALATACQHVPPAPLAPATRAGAAQARRLDAPEVREALERALGPGAAPAPGEPWTLAQLTVAALTLRSDLKVARASAAVAGAQVETAGQRPNPTLSVSPQGVANASEGVSPWLAVVQLDWPIETAGKRKHRLAAARERANAAELAVRNTVWSIRGQVYAALAAVAAADARHSRLVRTAAAQGELLALLEGRLEAGATSEAAIAPERVAQVQLAGDRAAAERQRREARAALAAALGVSEAALAGVAFDLPLDALPEDVEALASGAARRAALLGRSDVLVLLAEYDAAEADLRLELAKQVPDLHLGPGYEYDQGLHKWGLGAWVELPIMYQNQGGIAEASARRAELAARFDALQAQVIAEVDAALASLGGARGEVEAARSLVATTERQRARAQAALEAGASERSSLLVAELAADRAALVLVDAQERAQLAASQLEQAVQPTRPFAPLVAPETR